ncbi:MmcQ/YjbR family DNA-binding protein [Fodinibius halophilus]|uniref:MmcQ/YjbR family DNA-binding protein n=1 Tax=Fodinibius halophilus TaxID=1736908 RepID=A0A6M1T7L3_9BACT|nr:MmcQ/YjbR family DNA-binding protein [Fodinibius halophilus]NGP89385.1 MmcQ/YjbR family DNA-binding protein [Fodinibius halophilus]
MDIIEYRTYCLSFPGVTEGFPFDEQTLVFKVKGKMFSATDVDTFELVNVKCDPVKAIDLRERYSFVIPGYHMNKKHWNSIKMDEAVPDHLLKEWISDSYRLVVDKLPKKTQKELQQL